MKTPPVLSVDMLTHNTDGSGVREHSHPTLIIKIYQFFRKKSS